MLLPHEKMGLIRDLATKLQSINALSKKYGITPEGVRQFRTRNQARIDKVAEDLDNEWAGIWVADKKNRVIALQSQIESLLEQLENEENSDKARRELRNTIRAVAEELGQLTQKVESTGGYKISINGVDLENLK